MQVYVFETSCNLCTDPVITLQHSSYMLNEASAEKIIHICVILQGPSGGLATGLSFDITFSVEEDSASNIL